MWDTHRSFYFSADGSVKLDFQEHLKKKISLFQAKIVDIDLNVSELSLFSRETRIEGNEVD